MGRILAFVGGPIAGYVFGAALAALALTFAVTVGVYHYKLADMTEQRDGYRERIENPTTGYVAKNAQCGTNVAQLTKGLDRISKEVEDLAKATKDGDARTAAIVADAVARSRGVKTSTDKLLALLAPASPGTLKACDAGALILKRGVFQ